MLFTYIDTEYEVHTYCPHCGNEDVVIKIDDLGFFRFYSCNSCGLVQPKKKFNNKVQNSI